MAVKTATDFLAKTIRQFVGVDMKAWLDSRGKTQKNCSRGCAPREEV